MNPNQKTLQDLQNRVIQETKNCMDQQYGIYQKIEETNRLLQRIVKEQDEKISKLQSDLKSLQIVIENLTQSLTDKVKACDKMLDRYQVVMDCHAKHISTFGLQCDRKYVSQHRLGVLQEDNVKRLDTLEKSDEILASHLRNQYDILCRRIDQSADNLMKDMVGQIPSVEPIKEKLTELTHDTRINMNGFKKDLERCRYQIYYSDKKIESIFTRLEKLEGAK